MLLRVYNVVLEDYTGQILVGTVTSVREIRPKGKKLNRCSIFQCSCLNYSKY